MYIRTKVFHNKDESTRTYLQLMTAERTGNKVRQKVMANLERLEDLKTGGIDRLIENLNNISR